MNPNEQGRDSLVLLTGGTGFVGSRVARRLIARGRRVRAIVRAKGKEPALADARVEEIEGDFIDPEVVSRAIRGADEVVHCAATAGSDLEPVRHVNVDGTRTMVEAALAAKVRRYVHISTLSVYADSASTRIGEDAPLKDSGDPYGWTKADGDRVVLDAIGRGLRGTILRPGAILGAHPTSTWAMKIPARVRDREIKLRIDGLDLLPWVHVEDLVDAVLLALEDERAVGRVYNLVAGHVTWRDFTDSVRAWFGTPPLDVISESEVPAGAYRTTRFDGSRIRNELGYAPRRSYDEGMAEAAAAWNAQAAAPRE